MLKKKEKLWHIYKLICTCFRFCRLLSLQQLRTYGNLNRVQVRKQMSGEDLSFMVINGRDMRLQVMAEVKIDGEMDITLMSATALLRVGFILIMTITMRMETETRMTGSWLIWSLARPNVSG